MDFFSKSKNLPSKKGTFLFVLITIVLILILDLFVNQIIADQFRKNQEMLVSQELGTIRAKTEGLLNTNFFLINGMAAYISSRSGISSSEFNTLGKILLQKSDFLKNIAAAPDFIIRYIYPLENNEKAIGLDYRTVPDQWTQALAAKTTGLMALAGPLPLVQGGEGLIARIPVYNDIDGSFWGLVSAVIDYEVLITETGIKNQDLKLDLAIRGKDSKGSDGDVFWGNPELFEEKRQSLTTPVTLPSGSWIMAAIPRNGWADHSPYYWVIHLTCFLTALAACLAIIKERKNRFKLIESEQQLKAMIRSSHDALVMIDSKDNITFCNPAMIVMFGYTGEELTGKKFHELITLPEDFEKSKIGMIHFARTGEGPVLNSIMEMVAVKKSGQVFPVERSVASFKHNGEWCAVGSVRDITIRKEAEKLLTERATTDPLTQLANRRHFLELSSTELRKAVRYQRPFSLMMFDIDHFKKINDTYGHDGGDKGLMAVAETVRNTLRNVDIIGRVGGEEFAVSIPETNLSAASQAAERLRLALMNCEIKTDTAIIKLTVSIGVAQLTEKNENIDDLMKKADERLYTAKRSGRNQVVWESKNE